MPSYFDVWQQGLILMGINGKHQFPCNEGHIYMRTDEKISAGVKRNWHKRREKHG